MYRTSSFNDSGVQTQGIYQFIPPDLRRMFYKNPARVHASHNGLDPYGFSTDGLVLYLPLWALKDSAFKSVDYFKHTATSSGTAISWTPDGWSFGGTDELITIPDHASLDIEDYITLEMWIKPSTDLLTVAEGHASVRLIVKGTDAYFFYWGAGIAGGLGLFSTGITPNELKTDQDLLADTWYHLAATFNSVTKFRALYVNGSELSHETVTNGNFDVNATDVTISAAGETIPGLVGEVRIYNRDLSAGEVAYNYNSTIWRYQ